MGNWGYKLMYNNSSFCFPTWKWHQPTKSRQIDTWTQQFGHSKCMEVRCWRPGPKDTTTTKSAPAKKNTATKAPRRHHQHQKKNSHKNRPPPWKHTKTLTPSPSPPCTTIIILRIGVFPPWRWNSLRPIVHPIAWGCTLGAVRVMKTSKDSWWRNHQNLNGSLHRDFKHIFEIKFVHVECRISVQILL